MTTVDWTKPIELCSTLRGVPVVHSARLLCTDRKNIYSHVILCMYQDAEWLHHCNAEGIANLNVTIMENLTYVRNVKTKHKVTVYLYRAFRAGAGVTGLWASTTEPDYYGDNVTCLAKQEITWEE